MASFHIILDFDGTITADDTVDNLAAFAVAFQEERARNSANTADTADAVDWAGRWKAIVDDYLVDHGRHKAGYAPPEQARTSVAHELDYLRSLCDVDCRSIRALRDARLFAGLAPLPDRLVAAGRWAVETAAAKDAAQRGSRAAYDKMDGVRLRPGFPQFLSDTAARRRWPVSVVSINWSDAWIQGVIAAAAAGTAADAVDVPVFANRITESGAIVPSFESPPRSGFSAGAGDVDDDADNRRPIASCFDKLKAMEAAEEAAAAAAANNRNRIPVVYMGDSTTDLECLLRAGESSNGSGGGIVLADGDGPTTSKLLMTLARLGYAVPHVSAAASFQEAGRGSESEGAPRLAWARDFNEIMASKILG